MKKLFLLIALLALLASSAVALDDGGGSYITGYWNVDGTECNKVFTPYAPHDLYLYLILNTAVVDTVTAVEFRLDNWVPDSGGMITYNWETELAIPEEGGIVNGMSLAFPGTGVQAVALPDGRDAVLLGTLTLLGLGPDWPTVGGAPHQVTVLPNATTDILTMVDEHYVQYDIGGGWFTFNGDVTCPNVAAEKTSWSEIKSLY
ncbi:MAG: hypothetical protein GY835_07015 [bacterium]|nr:hypothetical protein [bacterium]